MEYCPTLEGRCALVLLLKERLPSRCMGCTHNTSPAAQARSAWSATSGAPLRICAAQIAAVVRRGGRPEVPPREALPGADTAGWDGLDDYVQLMR